MDLPANPKHPDPAVPKDDLPETDASRAIRGSVAEVIGTLQRLHAALAVGVGRLTDDERRSGQGKLLDGEAAVLAQIAQVAANQPAFMAGLAAKDGGVDPSVFEGDALRAHLALHVAARDATRAIAKEAAALHTLLSDLSLYHGAQARRPLLAAYKLLAAVALHDPSLAKSIAPVREFFDRPARTGSGDGSA